MYKNTFRGELSEFDVLEEDEKIMILDDEESNYRDNAKFQKNWGEGIIIKRLRRGKIEFIDNYLNETEEEVFDPENSVFF
jgi:hypothetical protein